MSHDDQGPFTTLTPEGAEAAFSSSVSPYSSRQAESDRPDHCLGQDELDLIRWEGEGGATLD